ncbi:MULTISPECIES: NAD-dependent epimerase/dehydratase family protein [unclassified Exiguobacterium]|uniref:polysaccharide biosynthesis C-terminal domain-containing protein n=1 Tax=unclassified Exiguobacterium TaxID=2644629 RepID=UPI001BEBA328|nr:MULTISPECIES: NAD-dependent epimerase/dehydratase family protein [unclassified Exiguobacterium]
MNILITGSNGFVGKNLVAELKNQGYEHLMLCDRNTSEEELMSYTQNADFVFHLAGVNRPKNNSEFVSGNQGFTEKLVALLSKGNTKPPIMFASSTQAELSNPYGESKREAERAVRTYGQENNVEVMIYRFPNLFGKWCKPNYNSVVATFCHNISHGIAIQVNDESITLTVAYIDDVIASLISILSVNNRNSVNDFYNVSPTYDVTLGRLVDLLTSFKQSRSDLSIAQLDNGLVKKLYSTYLSYLPERDFSYDLKMHKDERGSFTEFIRTPDRGQVSVNISKPGITKGNHWHHTKNEKFLVVSGQGVIRFRKIESAEVIEYFVSGEKLEVVDIPVGYTHNIENLGNQDMVTLMWVNEPFDSNRPDTYYLEV